MRRYLSLILITGLLGGGCRSTRPEQLTLPLREVNRAVAVLHPTADGNAGGLVRFVQVGDKVQVHAELTGLEPNSQHGFHIHEYGDCSAADASSAGGHYNPDGSEHALPPARPRHAGDLGNVSADATGRAVLDIIVDNISIAGDNNPILGRAIVVHAKSDDGSQPTGAAGPRLGCGVIGISMPVSSDR